MRRNDQHPGAGRRAADAATNGHRRQRSCAELRRGLPARRRGRDSGRGLPAQALRAPLRHAGTRRRAPQERLHRQLPPHQSRGLRQERPRNRDAEPPPFRHLAPVARRPGFDPHLGQDPAGERRDPGHHHARRSRRPAADLRRTGDQGLEHGKHRLERRRQPAHLAAHPRDAPRNQRQETLAAAPAEYLRHQHQPRLPLGRAAAGHPRPAFAAGRPSDRGGRGGGDPQRRENTRQRRQKPQRTQPRSGVHRPDPRPHAGEHPRGDPRDFDSRETGPRGRPDHRRHPDRHVRAPAPHDHLHHPKRQPDAARAGPFDVPRMPRAGCRNTLLRNRHASRGSLVARHRIRTDVRACGC